MSDSGKIRGGRAVALMLFFAAVALMFFIVSQGLGLYRDSRATSDRHASAIECVGYIYTVTGVSASQETLSFTFRNELSSTSEVSKITVSSGLSEQVFDARIPIGSSLEFNLPFRPESNFTLYPNSCKIFPTTCNLYGQCVTG